MTDRFKQLTPAEQVEAIMAVLREPCSRGVIYKFAGLDPKSFDSEMAAAVEQVFARWHVPDVSTPEQPRYWVPPDRQAEVATKLGGIAYDARSKITALGLARYGKKKTK